MNRDLQRRLVRLERAAEPTGVRYIVCPFPIDEDNPPTPEEIEASVMTPMSNDEWEAAFCGPGRREFDGWAWLRAKMARQRLC